MCNGSDVVKSGALGLIPAQAESLGIGGGPQKTDAENQYDQLKVQELQQQLGLTGELAPLLAAQIKQSAADQAQSKAIQDRTYDLIYNGGQGTPLSGSQEGQAQAAFQQFQQQQHLSGIQQQLADIQLEAIKNGGKATPEQAALIDQQTQSAQTSGESDINRWLQQAQRQIQEENAQAAGLRPTDAPVTANIGRAAEEAARQQGQLTLGLKGANAQAKLNYPLQAQGVQTQASSATAGLASAAQQFQAQLAQQAQANRLALAQSPISNSLGFAGLNSQPSTNNASPNNTLGQLGQLAGGIGGMMAAFSDRRLKSNIKRIGTHPIGVGIYEYDIFGERQTGVMAQELLNVMPGAVILDPSGYYMVNYSLLV